MITFNDLKSALNPLPKLSKIWKEFWWYWNNSWYHITGPAEKGFAYTLGASFGALPAILLFSWLF